MKHIYTALIMGFLAFSTTAFAQVTLDPFFATDNDIVTVTFDASAGNGALTGATQVYAHTGVITNLSTGPSDWRHVVGNWGTVDPSVEMTSQGNDIHTIEIDIQNFYALQSGEEVLSLAFVFRNADGSVVGRASDGGDIFVPLYTGGFGAVLTAPTAASQLITAHQQMTLSAMTSAPSTISLYLDDSLLLQNSNAAMASVDFQTSDFAAGKHYLWMEADNGTTVERDSVYYLFHTAPSIETPPSVGEGLTVTSPTSAIFRFSVPSKNFIYLIGDFNNWELDENYKLKRSPDNTVHWIEITGLQPGVEYRYQYSVDADQMRVADIYSTKILDPWNDQYIEEETYPNLIDYPVGKTNDAVSVFQTDKPEYAWDETINFTAPAQSDLVIYELLMRDFVQEHNYETVIDSLDYLAKLGVNAIELMPFFEFEGNDSWGYNPAFFFAPDKYYGTEEALKRFVEECHRRGIAVIMDMVLNHSFGQNPQVRLFFDPSAGQYGQPTAQNPWFLQTAAHDFNVGYDYNHESPATRVFSERVLRHWIEEYRIDGYRMDLSKGFTSNVTIGNVSAFGQYDASRVAILKHLADDVWTYAPEAYMILEHFADNDEERELANYGFMLWGNLNHQFTEAAMGFGDSFDWLSYQERGWNSPHVVGYMESHDEERMMYKNKNFGKVEGDYNVREEVTGLQRSELATVFFMSVPGPKMVWQFGEMGFDFSINRCEDGSIEEGCRLSKKPIRWDYLNNGNRKRLFDIYAAMIDLHVNNETFKTDDFDMEVSQQAKVIRLNDANMNAVVVGNFDTDVANVRPNFQHDGIWYEYFTGDSLKVENTDDIYSLKPGEYWLYTDVRLEVPNVEVGMEEPEAPASLTLYPNPANEVVSIARDGNSGNAQVRITDVNGRLVQQISVAHSGLIQLETSALSVGVYTVEVADQQGVKRQQLIIQR